MVNHASTPRPVPDILAGVAVLVALVAVAGVLVMRGGVYFSQWVPDVFIPLEGALHIRAGQWPHRDFVTPVGSAWYLLHALLAQIVPLSARLLIAANLVVALVAASAALIVCRGKMPRGLAMLCALYVGLVALSPRQIGEGISHISNNATYNRHCWALIGVIALAALLPAPGRRRETSDGAIAGLLIAACFYIKITYAAAGLGFVTLAMVTVRGFAGWRFAAVAGAVAGAVILVAGLGTGDLPGYLADMHTAVRVLPDTARLFESSLLLAHALPSLMLVVLLAVVAGARPDRATTLANPGLWAGLLTALAGIAIGIQNHPEPENPLLPLALLIAWMATRGTMEGPWRYGETPGLIAVGAALVLSASVDLLAVGWTLVAPIDTSTATQWMAATRITDVRIGSGFTGPDLPFRAEIPQSDAAVLARWDEAIVMLRPHLGARRDAIVLPLIWDNPFPLLLGLPPVRHEVAWWDATRTFNAQARPDPRVLLDPVDFVLVSRDYANPMTGEAMWDAYGAHVMRDFRVVEHGPHWDLWARRDCARRRLC
jgi:hypothetical protein